MRSAVLLTVVTLGLIPSMLFAQTKVDLRVRAVEATDLVPMEVKMQQTRKTRITVSKDLQDLRSQLANLHYSQFKLVSSMERVIALQQEEVFPIAHKHTLRLTPVSLDDDRVCVQLKWLDDQGSEVLNTKLHLQVGESMVTGTDVSGKDDGLVLAIDVKPVGK